MAKTFQEKLNDKIAAAQAETTKKEEKALEKLLDNEAFVESQRSVAAKAKELDSLNEIILQLNAIAPFVATDGRKFSINVFPIGIFGTGLGEVMGIIQGSRSAFVGEKMIEYSAITGISSLELQEAQTALGSPAFYKDGKVVDAIPGNYEKLQSLLKGIFIKLQLSEFKAEQITEDRFNLWFQTAENKANKQLLETEEFNKLEEGAKDFVIEE